MVVAGTGTFETDADGALLLPIALLLVAGVVVAIAGGFALAMWRRKWLIADLPTSDAAHVFVGMNEVVGRAIAVDQPIVAPYSASECVWYRSVLEKEVQSGNDQRSWKTVADDQSDAPFWVEDDTGRVLIRPKGASVDAPQRTRDIHSGKPQRYGRLSLLQSLSGSGSLPLSLDTSRYRTTEWYLLPGDQIYILGEATLRDEVVALEFSPCDPRSGVHKRSLLIARGDERRAANRTAVLATLLLFVTLVAAAALPAAYHAFRTAQDGGPTPGDPSTLGAAGEAMVFAAVVVIVVLAVLYVGRLFNRLVSVRNRAESAWSLIDVHLRRRRDLLPSLAEVVGAAAAHERSVHATIARLRTVDVLPEPQELPDSRTIVSTETVDAADRAEVRVLLAVSEAYPELRTSEDFRRLAAEIALTESGISFARGFYNDAITVMRDRRQRFPGFLLAPLVKVPSLDLWAEGTR